MAQSQQASTLGLWCEGVGVGCVVRVYCTNGPLTTYLTPTPSHPTPVLVTRVSPGVPEAVGGRQHTPLNQWMYVHSFAIVTDFNHV
jgi:hypothetical protein